MAEQEQEVEKGEGKEEGGGEGQAGGILVAITEQRMIEHMQSLDKFYSHYDNQQYAAVIEMEHEVCRCIADPPAPLFRTAVLSPLKLLLHFPVRDSYCPPFRDRSSKLHAKCVKTPW